MSRLSNDGNLELGVEGYRMDYMGSNCRNICNKALGGVEHACMQD
jgi:hypothetical protein